MLHTTISPAQNQSDAATQAAVQGALRSLEVAQGEDRRFFLKREKLATKAAKSGPLAVAAATNDAERSLISAIFGAVPEVLRLSNIHSQLEAEDKPSDAADRRWCRARMRVEAQADKLLKIPTVDAASAYRRIKLHAEIMEYCEFGPASQWLEQWFDEDVRKVAASAVNALKFLAEREAAPRSMAEMATWQAVLDRFQTASAAGKVADAVDDPNADSISDIAAEAEAALLRTPAPNVSAAAYKMRQHLSYEIARYVSDDVDNPRHFSAFLATDDAAVREPLLIYQDLLRLAGERPDVAAAQPYDPSPLLDSCASADIQLSVLEVDDGKLIAVPLYRPTAPQRPDIESVLDALIQPELCVIERHLQRRERAGAVQ